MGDDEIPWILGFGIKVMAFGLLSLNCIFENLKDGEEHMTDSHWLPGVGKAML